MSPGYREIEEEELHRIVKELPRRPFLIGDRGLRLSLAGAQSKIPVYLQGNRVFLAVGNAPSTHILKPPIPGIEESVENEAFCMTLAARMGLRVPNASLRHGRDRLYIVERYDREYQQGGENPESSPGRFLPGLGDPSGQKYEAEGGPSLEMLWPVEGAKRKPWASDQKALLSWSFSTPSSETQMPTPRILRSFTHRVDQGLRPSTISSAPLFILTFLPGLRCGSEGKIGCPGSNSVTGRGSAVGPGLKPRWTLTMVRDISHSATSLADSVARDFMETYGRSAMVEKVVQIIKKAASRFIAST